jgi:transposase
MMEHLSVEHLAIIEREVTHRILTIFKIDLDLVLYDYTNFFTFIDTDNKRNSIAQRGKNKQKRNDLRQFCLAMLVVRKHRIPLFSHIYEGNKSDCSAFGDTIGDIQTLLQDFVDVDDVTIVFDKGSNSKANFKSLGELNYVASLSTEHDAEIKNIPFNEFYDLEIKDECAEDDVRMLKCYRTKKIIWDAERTVVVYKSDALFEGQLKGLKSDLSTTLKLLLKLHESGKSGFYLKKGNKKTCWTFELFEKQVEQTINKRFVRDVIDFKISRLKNNRFELTFEKNIKSYNRVKQTVLGKRILLSSRHDWSDVDIINAYHGQADVERSFRQIKNPFHNCVRPQYHWTDQKIKVHTFCSVLSLTLSSLIEMVAKEGGFSMSCDDIYYRLEDLRKAKYVYKGEKKNGYEVEYRLEEAEDPQNLELFKLLTS